MKVEIEKAEFKIVELEEKIESAVQTNKELQNTNDQNTKVVYQAQGIINERNKALEVNKMMN